MRLRTTVQIPTQLDDERLVGGGKLRSDSDRVAGEAAGGIGEMEAAKRQVPRNLQRIRLFNGDVPTVRGREPSFVLDVHLEEGGVRGRSAILPAGDHLVTPGSKEAGAASPQLEAEYRTGTRADPEHEQSRGLKVEPAVPATLLAQSPRDLNMSRRWYGLRCCLADKRGPGRGKEANADRCQTNV